MKHPRRTEWDVRGLLEHGDVIDRLTLEWLLSHLTDEEQDLLWLHEVEEMTLEEVGRVIGLKYRGKELTGSAIRYHKDKILQRLRHLRTEAGIE